MKDDLISRQAAISEIMEDIKDRSLHDDPATPEDYAEGYDEGTRNAAVIVLQMPSAQQWIPCSERLPDNKRQVLVYAWNVHFALAKYDEMREADGTYKKQWVTFDAWKPYYKIKEVIAWMPLPEPGTLQGGRR